MKKSYEKNVQPCIAGGLPSGAVTCVRWVLTYAGHVCVAFVGKNELQFYGKMVKKETIKKMKKNIWMPFLSKKHSTNPNENVCVCGVCGLLCGLACCARWRGNVAVAYSRWVVCVLHVFCSEAHPIFHLYPLFLWVKMENEMKL